MNEWWEEAGQSVPLLQVSFKDQSVMRGWDKFSLHFPKDVNVLVCRAIIEQLELNQRPFN